MYINKDKVSYRYFRLTSTEKKKKEIFLSESHDHQISIVSYTDFFAKILMTYVVTEKIPDFFFYNTSYSVDRFTQSKEIEKRKTLIQKNYSCCVD